MHGSCVNYFHTREHISEIHYVEDLLHHNQLSTVIPIPTHSNLASKKWKVVNIPKHQFLTEHPHWQKRDHRTSCALINTSKIWNSTNNTKKQKKNTRAIKPCFNCSLLCYTRAGDTEVPAIHIILQAFKPLKYTLVLSW